MHSKLAILLVVIPLIVACGSDDSTPAPSDAGATDVAADQPAATDAPSTDAPAADAPTPDAPAADTSAADAAAVPLLNDCREANYIDRSGAMDDRTVVPRGTTGYTPRCFMIRAGQSVTFSMDFTVHPLVSGVPHGSSVGATTPSPIVNQSSGSSYMVTFPGAGHFPFYCRTHAHVGMAGVVMVMP